MSNTDAWNELAVTLDDAQREKARQKWEQASDEEKRGLMFEAYVLGLFDPSIFRP